MGNPRDRDRLDAWLNAEVEPLAPPPGTFERIRHRARRRKAGRAVMSAAGIVIVIAAAVAVPRIASTLVHSHNGPGRPVAVGGPSSSPRTPTPSRRIESPKPFSGIKVLPATSSLSPQGSGIQVPRNFQPTSVTFVSQSIGAVIGQAGTPGDCATQYCTSLAGTSDYGTTWYGVSAPVTGAPDGSSGVGQVRFLDLRDGWAFGPELWVTHDGGAHWRQITAIPGRVVDLEAVGSRAFALAAFSCTGTGSAYASGCTSFALFSSAATSDTWTLVPGASEGLPVSTGSLQLTSQRGYIIADGALISGPVDGGAWSPASNASPGTPSCLLGAAQPNGKAGRALLAAGSGRIYVACTSVSGPGRYLKTIYSSPDGGASWQGSGTVQGPGVATSLAAAQGGLVVLATTAGIDTSTDGGKAWQQTYGSLASAAPGHRGFSYVGMTSQQLGVALPADALLHEVLITTDGGRTWQPHAVSGP